MPRPCFPGSSWTSACHKELKNKLLTAFLAHRALLIELPLSWPTSFSPFALVIISHPARAGWEVSVQQHGCLAAVWEGAATFGQAAAPLKSPQSQHRVGCTRKNWRAGPSPLTSPLCFPRLWAGTTLRSTARKHGASASPLPGSTARRSPELCQLRQVPNHKGALPSTAAPRADRMPAVLGAIPPA